ncbi:MAG: polysaccharide biosynthesis protein [Gallionellaceae bacterium]|jgi:FlaA1/EpsC-like NDP-sugar epimerase|nr:polysaccharide biosynthesis protein [Gallionellaceae bacterium]
MAKVSRYTLFVMAHDVCAAILAWFCAYLLRFDFDVPQAFRQGMWQTLLWVVPLQFLVFWFLGLYRGIWRYASISDLRRILAAVLLVALLIPLVFWVFQADERPPRSVLVMAPILLLLVMGGSRLCYRIWKERGLARMQPQGSPVLVLGAGVAGMGLAKELMGSRHWRLAGFLDDDAGKQGRMLNGVKVLGPLDSLARWTKELGVAQVIVAMPSVAHRLRKQAVDIATRAGVNVLTVPSFDDLLSGRVAISQLRAVELDDLLGRDPVQLDDAGLNEQITGKTVLVTGAGGSIGSELCRQITRFFPERLVLFEASEFLLYNIEQELEDRFPGIDIIYLAGDVRDNARLEQVFTEYRPDIVFHAAAYKHVPLMERHNAWQAVRNNVFGSWCVATCAQRHGVEKFVLISTDKAVNPTNVMGATKRLAESICQSLQQPDGTHFVIVRFGNVLGSNGSVIPKFREQIASGGPITVTHPEITRYFMSIPEAAQLVMQAGCMGKGGEIFVLDMGEPVRIVDLAKDLIRLSGLSEEDIRIEFTGLRPGEKLYEELLADNENTLPTRHPKLRIASVHSASLDAEDMKELQQWMAAGAPASDNEVRKCLRRWVPEYAPEAAGVSPRFLQN